VSDYLLPSISASAALERLAAGGVRLIDVRKAEARAESGCAIPGALWRDPFRLPFDAGLAADRTPAIVYCVKGHEVGQCAAAWLLMNGVDAVYVRGGFNALVEAGAATAPLDPEARP
jgi:rhodanese-related sulfurtransferase